LTIGRIATAANSSSVDRAIRAHQPITPYIEAFNGRFRAECLDQHWFASLEEARQIIEA
jgi:hypothetical protein